MPATRDLVYRAAALLALLVATINVLHRVIVPPRPPDQVTFPDVGDTFASRVEGFSQQVIAVRNGGLVLRTHIAPGAQGPPMHAHRGFTEIFKVESGTLQIDLVDRTVAVGPGDVYRIPAGTAHRPHNPRDVMVVVASDEPVMPQAFGACLVQMYHFLDREPGRPGPALALRMAAMDDICDSTLTDVPLAAQAIMQWLVVPFARLAGYRNYYPEFSLHPEAAQVVSEAAERPDGRSAGAMGWRR